MRYAHNELGSPPIGVEPQPRENVAVATVVVTDYDLRNVITICDKGQLQQVVDLLRDAAFINGWGSLQ